MVLLLQINTTAASHEGEGWCEANTLYVTKAEADKLHLDAPQCGKLGVVASVSPVENAGLRSDDIIHLTDSVEPAFKAIAEDRPNSELRLRMLSGGRDQATFSPHCSQSAPTMPEACMRSAPKSRPFIVAKGLPCVLGKKVYPEGSTLDICRLEIAIRAGFTCPPVGSHALPSYSCSNGQWRCKQFCFPGSVWQPGTSLYPR